MVTARLMTAQSWDYSPVLWWSRWRERISSLDLLDWMLTVQIDQNYLVLVYWTCGLETEESSLYAEVDYSHWMGEKKEHSKANPKESPLWEAVYSQICHALIQRVSFYLTFIVERVWFLYLAQLLISDYIKCCIIWWFRGFTCICAKKTMRRNINTISWLSGKQTSKTLKGEAWAIRSHLQKH